MSHLPAAGPDAGRPMPRIGAITDRRRGGACRFGAAPVFGDPLFLRRRLRRGVGLPAFGARRIDQRHSADAQEMAVLAGPAIDPALRLVIGGLLVFLVLFALIVQFRFVFERVVPRLRDEGRLDDDAKGVSKMPDTWVAPSGRRTTATKPRSNDSIASVHYQTPSVKMSLSVG